MQKRKRKGLKRKKKVLTEELETIFSLKEYGVLDFQMCHKMKVKLSKVNVQESKLSKQICSSLLVVVFKFQYISQKIENLKFCISNLPLITSGISDQCIYGYSLQCGQNNFNYLE